MAKMRWLKPEILTDEKTAKLSDGAYRLFTGLLLQADDSGVYPLSFDSMKASVFPLRRTNTAQIAKLFTELSTADLVERYQLGKKEYMLIKTFARHQIIPWKRRSYRYPTKMLGKIPTKPKTIEEAMAYDQRCNAYAMPEQCQDNADAVQEQCCDTINSKELILNNKKVNTREESTRGYALASPDVFHFKTSKLSTKIKQEYVEELEKNFPGVDIISELGNMNQWYCDKKAQITYKSFRSKVRGWMTTAKEELTEMPKKPNPYTKCKKCKKEILKVDATGGYCQKCDWELHPIEGGVAVHA